jgi:nucleotide-binding universal stress UspA family protein
MEKILVTTDLSANSASAIRFAHKLCLLRGAAMIVLHVDELPVPTGWSLAEINLYQQEREVMNKARVQSFLNRICMPLRKPMVQTQIEIKCSPNTVTAIIESCTENDCQYICISTHGAGKMKRIIGTHTSKLIARSLTPVISIPSLYRIRKIKDICYASDMMNYKKELKTTLQFSAPIGARLTLLHIVSPSLTLASENKLQTELKEIAGEDISLKLLPRDIVHTLHHDLDIEIKKINPSMVVFFNHQQHSIIDQLFYATTAQSQSFTTKIPILSFRKSSPH